MKTLRDLRIGDQFTTPSGPDDLYEKIAPIQGFPEGPATARRTRDGELYSFAPSKPVEFYDCGESRLLPYIRVRVRLTISCDFGDADSGCTESDDCVLAMDGREYDRVAAAVFHERGWRAMPYEDVVLCPTHARQRDLP